VKRIILLAAALLLIYAAGQTAMNLWTCWSPETKANVFVAAGTILLAVATFWSVWETRLVIRGEDRRHQQSFAPSLRLDSSATPIGVFCVTNRGKGLASNIRVHLTVPVYFLATSGVETSEQVTVERTISQVAVREKAFLNLHSGLPERNYHAVAAHAVIFAYEDMFGNEYGTLYHDWNRNEFDFEWNQPQSLQLR
jgi:hypothetical protein